MNNNGQNHDIIVAEALRILGTTRDKLASEHPALFRKIQKLMAEQSSLPVKEEGYQNIREKNRAIIMRFMKLKKFGSESTAIKNGQE